MSPLGATRLALLCLGVTGPAEAQGVAELFGKVAPTVVVVRAKAAGADGQARVSDIGSGVVVSKDGKIMTAAHLVHGAAGIAVQQHVSPHKSIRHTSRSSRVDLGIRERRFDRPMRLTMTAVLVSLLTLVEVAAGAGPAAAEGQAPAAGGPPAPNRPGSTATRVDPAQATRLQQVMIPLIKVMDHPMPLNQVKVGIVDDPQINAANAGGDQFFVTIGLLQKANDDQLRAVLAHELAHQDLNHVTKAQVLGTGVNIGAAILHQVFPGSGAIGPLAGALVTRKYSRNEEYAADRHGVELLRRAGYPKDMMIKTLTWLLQTSGPDSGGILSTHPGTAARIEALRKTS